MNWADEQRAWTEVVEDLARRAERQARIDRAVLVWTSGRSPPGMHRVDGHRIDPASDEDGWCWITHPSPEVNRFGIRFPGGFLSENEMLRWMELVGPAIAIGFEQDDPSLHKIMRDAARSIPRFVVGLFIYFLARPVRLRWMRWRLARASGG